MRLFIAIDLKKEIKDYLYNLENELKKKLPATIRWVNKKNLHLTLKFLGEINEDKIKELKQKLSKINFKEFDLQLDKISYFGNQIEIYNIWISIKPKDEMTRLAQKIDSETLEFSSKEQKFNSHLTLGRISKMKNIKLFKEILEKTEIRNLNFKVNSFLLIESTLTKDGPKYKIIEEYNLKSITTP
jgi:2'-5' RNA ligase